MVEVAVLFVIKKIGLAVAVETLKLAKPLLGKNSEMQMALPVNMKLIKDELELINAFLKEIGMKGSNGEVIETWIRQVRRVAYDMEDIVDQFMYVVGEQQQKNTLTCVTKLFKKQPSLFSIDEIATKADIINKELMELSKRICRWSQPISAVNYVPATTYDCEHQLYQSGLDHSINDDELVGIGKSREVLIHCLHIEKQSNNHALVAIWRNLLKEIHGNENRTFDALSMDSAELRVELKKIVDKRRYLIILDDVWTADVLIKIREVLVDNGLGSRVIITTRIQEVASVAEEDCRIKLEPLNEHDAWLLFCRKAFPKSINHVCPIELHQCGKNIVEKCDGLPLALVAIGSLLSLKTRNIKEWRFFYNQLITELHNNKNLNQVEKILNLSYKHLPNHLKNCYLYCAMFPEDYLIHRKRLIRLWITEGFIEQNGGCSLEDVAEVYLEELVRRSMLQVVARNSFDRIQCLRMHDLVRELAIFQSKKESFCAIYDDTHGAPQVGLAPRRLSVLQCKNGIQSGIDASRLRTFIAFDTCMASSSWYSFMPSETIPSSVGELFNLRYLCLDDTNLKELPKSITKLHNLQTLSLKRTKSVKLPQGFSKLKKIRHLHIWKLLDATYRSLNNWESMEPFDGIWNLKELQSLHEIRATKAFIAKLGNLSQLKSLSISRVRCCHCSQLCNSLSKMQHLTRLHIRSSNEDELLLLDKLSLQNPLEKLDLIGRLSKGTLGSPFFSTHGSQLLQMELSWCHLIESPVVWLSGLSNLTELRLTRAYTGQELNFHGKCFSKLKKIVLWDLPLVNQICIQEGALISLEYIHIYGLKELRDLPTGIKFLNSVKAAYFTRMHPDFVRNLIKGKLNHIPKVYWSTQGVSMVETEPANLPEQCSAEPQWRILGSRLFSMGVSTTSSLSLLEASSLVHFLFPLFPFALHVYLWFVSVIEVSSVSHCCASL